MAWGKIVIITEVLELLLVSLLVFGDERINDFIFMESKPDLSSNKRSFITKISVNDTNQLSSLNNVSY